MQITVESIVADGDEVATRGYWTGTNKGSFMGMPSTGKKVKVPYVDWWKIQNGKFTENWVQMDMQVMFTQMGVMPAHNHA
jgi:predicted ester cyclase